MLTGGFSSDRTWLAVLRLHAKLNEGMLVVASDVALGQKS